MTKIIKVDPVNFRKDELKIAIDTLIDGGTVAFPTETVYGLGADAFNSRAVKKIFEAKGRPLDNPIIVHLGEFDQLDSVAKHIPRWVKDSIDTLWPGPVTFVLPKAKKVPNEVTAGLPTVAVRMPAHPIPLTLAKETGPIGAPSANLSGRPSPTIAEHVIRDLYERVDVIIDGGETFFGLESTVIDATEDPPVLLRPGPMTLEELEEATGKKFKIHPVALVHEKVNTPKSPGMKYRHYAPRAKLILVEGDYDKALDRILELYNGYRTKRKKVALLVTKETAGKLNLSNDIIILGDRRNLYTVAKNLFKALRELDERNYEIGISESFELKGVGLAIMNRIRKAADSIVKA